MIVFILKSCTTKLSVSLEESRREWLYRSKKQSADTLDVLHIFMGT